MKIKQIIATVSIAGNGNPNKEGKDGKFLWNAYAKSRKEADDSSVQFALNDNVSFAKANYYFKEGKIVRVSKVSGDCLRHNIAGSINNAAIKEDKTTWIAYSASKEGIWRGYLNPSKSGTTVKNKSSITVTDAELDNGAISQLENHSSSGPRTDTSFFAKESLGKTHFTFQVFINLSELGVLSCSDTFDRPCVLEEDQQLFEQQLTKNGIEFAKKALRLKFDQQGEICYQFSDKTVNDIVNDFFAKVADLNFGNATERLAFEKMEITFVAEDGTRETVGFSNGKLEKSFEVASQYVESDFDEALAAERKVREMIQQTKEKAPKKKGKKTEKTETAEETN